MLKKNQIIIMSLVLVSILSLMPTAGLLAQNIEDEQLPINRYFSPEELKRADKVVRFLSSPEVVYSVLITFSLLVVFATYFVIVGLVVIVFFGRFL